MNSTDLIKQQVDFLKHDANHKHDYQLLKNGKSLFNLPKHQIYNTTHSPIQNYFINPKNNYSEKPFNGSSSFYIDFDVPKLDCSFYQFVLRFSLTNLSTTANSLIMASPLIIEKVSLLKNSNALGLDIDSWDIFLFNMQKYYKDLNKDDVESNLSMKQSAQGYLLPITYSSNGDTTNNNVEIPICLNRSDLLASAIKDNLVIRVYFKPDIVLDTIQNSDVKLSNVSLILRVQELNNSQLSVLYKQPKFNHLFNKRVVLRYNINKLTAGTEYSIPLAGFRNVCGAILLYIRRPENEIKYTTLGNLYSHIVNLQMDNVYIVDPTGRNIQNNNKQDVNWNNYLMANHFKRVNEVFNRMSYKFNNALGNRGHFTYLPFCADGSDSWDGVYSGGYSFNDNGDQVLRFTSLDNYDGNCVLTMMAFVPAILSVENGSLEERLG
jgi:hypothetical protein